MPAAYDTYDYPSYWLGREYEHKSEIIAIKAFLEKISHIKTILEVGAGHGRLTPSYIFRASRIILSDPSGRLLKIARSNLKSKKIRFIQALLENLPQKVRSHSADVVVVVRVLHHVDNLEKTFSIIKRLCKKNGYFILEFANKRHLKAILSEVARGNFTFPVDVFTKDVLSKRRKKSNLPFRNYHPDLILYMLKRYGFSVVEVRSVSNIRSPFIKKVLPLEFLLTLERFVQKPLASFFFGPSIFILSKKTR
ncbi:hypothetical protein A3A75_04110 [Candidatus Woesebacteria bacterium RIFCSPLOWO2_01_FULL_39_10]|uniref:Methyltransferase type 11 domain-containing protein n=1 Tax=Candidatus Woesebacteria bacterium RIFCSPLOWO2_01_FULL_39_10 TaxID=1802516 RepID=A0A1F8B8C9_9BACT|nr:MAG: hypothetical protein A3A75_04110 [Candidatus Woesebacteria bacterium RIFCSPLOWO2_01_FULL_39_10]